MKNTVKRWKTKIGFLRHVISDDSTLIFDNIIFSVFEKFSRGFRSPLWVLIEYFIATMKGNFTNNQNKLYSPLLTNIYKFLWEEAGVTFGIPQ